MLKENLTALRKAKGFSQEELAIRLHVVRQTVSKWEKGQSVPDADLLIKIADVFEVSVDELLGSKLENEKEIGDIAVQLSRINEHFAVMNRRSRRAWKSVAFALPVIIVIGAFVLVLNREEPNNNLPSPTDATQTVYTPGDNTTAPPSSPQEGNSERYPVNANGQTFGNAENASSLEELPDLIYLSTYELLGNEGIKEESSYVSKADLITLMPEKGQIQFINDLKISELAQRGSDGRPLGEAIILDRMIGNANWSFFNNLLPVVRGLFGEFTYRVNEKGETYGKYCNYNLVGSYPALVEAIAADATFGYVLFSDIGDGIASLRGTPGSKGSVDGAVAYIETGLGSGGDSGVNSITGSIPLYAFDGTTVIGEIIVVTNIRHSIHLFVGGTYLFDSYGLPGDPQDPDDNRVWSSSDTSVFTMQPDNLEITAVGPGVAVLSVTAGDRTNRFLIFVAGQTVNA